MKENKKIPKVMHSNSLTVDGDEHTKEVCSLCLGYLEYYTDPMYGWLPCPLCIE